VSGCSLKAGTQRTHPAHASCRQRPGVRRRGAENTLWYDYWVGNLKKEHKTPTDKTFCEPKTSGQHAAWRSATVSRSRKARAPQHGLHFGDISHGETL
jgi:hypothetical protein